MKKKILAIVGTRPEAIIAALEELLFDPRAYRAMAGKSNPYGNGRAAEAIAGILRGR